MWRVPLGSNRVLPSWQVEAGKKGLRVERLHQRPWVVMGIRIVDALAVPLSVRARVQQSVLESIDRVSTQQSMSMSRQQQRRPSWRQQHQEAAPRSSTKKQHQEAARPRMPLGQL